MEQKIITADNQYAELDQWIAENGCKKILAVCDDSIKYIKTFASYLNTLDRFGVSVIFFRGFQPNPLYENVTDGVTMFRDEECDGIIAVGGGSAIDVAKCIKLYSNMHGNGENGDFLKQNIVPNSIPFLAMPTTAGTGSEATRYAVIYYQEAKQSVTHESCIPSTVILDSSALNTLPEYQKKATMLDALCHAIESFWSVNSTDESKVYSKQALRLIVDNYEAYLSGDNSLNYNMLKASNLAGKAINITQTTAGHAMCYKITSLFGCAHGHAAALCDRVLYRWMIDNTDKCSDPRGEKYLIDTLDEIGRAMGCDGAEAGARRLNDIFDELNLEIPFATFEQFALLKNSVNPDRLKNHPIALNENMIDVLYHDILNGEE